MTMSLANMKKQGKLQLVDKSEEISKSYIIKADNCLKSAKILIKANLYENSVVNSYYAMYNCVTALLFKCGIKCENHRASIMLLKICFELDSLSNIIADAKKSRIDSQYYVSEDKNDVTLVIADDMIKKAEKFTLDLRAFISGISTEAILKARNKIEAY